MTREELADILDMIGTREGRLSNKPFTMKNLDELVYQLRKEPVASGAEEDLQTRHSILGRE